MKRVRFFQSPLPSPQFCVVEGPCVSPAAVADAVWRHSREDSSISPVLHSTCAPCISSQPCAVPALLCAHPGARMAQVNSVCAGVTDQVCLLVDEWTTNGWCKCLSVPSCVPQVVEAHVPSFIFDEFRTVLWTWRRTNAFLQTWIEELGPEAEASTAVQNCVFCASRQCLQLSLQCNHQH